MPRLQAEERYGGARLNRDPTHGAGLAVEAGGDVDRHPLAVGLIDAGDAIGGEAVDVAGKTGAVERIDDEISAVGREGFRGVDAAAPASGHFRGGLAQRAFLAE